jgi:hypothetical protein
MEGDRYATGRNLVAGYQTVRLTDRAMRDDESAVA